MQPAKACRITEPSFWTERAVPSMVKNIRIDWGRREDTFKKKTRKWRGKLLNEISLISNEHLDDFVTKISVRAPDSGERMIIGAVRARRIRVQRWRISEAINGVDPVRKLL